MNVLAVLLFNDNTTIVSINWAAHPSATLTLLPVVTPRIYSKYLDDSRGALGVTPGCGFDELIREPILLKGFLLTCLLSLHNMAHISMASAAARRDVEWLKQNRLREPEYKTAEALSQY